MAEIHDTCKAVIYAIDDLRQIAHTMPIGTYLEDDDSRRLKIAMESLCAIIRYRERPGRG